MLYCTVNISSYLHTKTDHAAFACRIFIHEFKVLFLQGNTHTHSHKEYFQNIQ